MRCRLRADNAEARVHAKQTKLLGYAAAAAIMALGGCGGDGGGGDPESAIVEEAKARLRRDARNPDSVEFRDVRLGSGEAFGSKAVCGEFNGENGLGGMTGFRRFLMLDGKVPLIEGAAPIFAQSWREAGC